MVAGGFNNRIFYACQAVCICRTGNLPTGGATSKVHFMHGMQSVGVTTNFSLDQAFELGQVEIYSNREEVADIEMTLEKVIDGDELIYLSAVGQVGGTPPSPGTHSLSAASNQRSDVYLAIYNDGVSAVDTATPYSIMMCSGAFVSSVSYTWPVDGNATESVSFVGSDKHWNDSTFGTTVKDPRTAFGSPNTGIGGTDTPASGTVRRTDILLTSPTVLPAEVQLQGNNAGAAAIEQGYHLQNVSCSADFGRDNILELGRFGPYTKYATFPFEVTSEFEVIATSGDMISVSGDHPGLQNRQITIADSAGTVVNLGGNNKLSSVSYSGGDTGGGNATLTYSYSTFNSFKVDGGWASAGYEANG